MWASQTSEDCLSPPSVTRPELVERFTPWGPPSSLRKGLGVSCLVHGEKVGKKRRAKGAISSFSWGVRKVPRKAGEYECSGESMLMR